MYQVLPFEAVEKRETKRRAMQTDFNPFMFKSSPVKWQCRRARVYLRRDPRVHLKRTVGVERAKRELPERVYSKELIEILFRQPYTKGQFLVDAGIAERQTAAEYLKELERIDLLRSEKLGRENLYLNVRLYDLLVT